MGKSMTVRYTKIQEVFAWELPMRNVAVHYIITASLFTERARLAHPRRVLDHVLATRRHGSRLVKPIQHSVLHVILLLCT